MMEGWIRIKVTRKRKATDMRGSAAGSEPAGRDVLPGCICNSRRRQRAPFKGRLRTRCSATYRWQAVCCNLISNDAFSLAEARKSGGAGGGGVIGNNRAELPDQMNIWPTAPHTNLLPRNNVKGLQGVVRRTMHSRGRG